MLNSANALPKAHSQAVAKLHTKFVLLQTRRNCKFLTNEQDANEWNDPTWPNTVSERKIYCICHREMDCSVPLPVIIDLEVEYGTFKERRTNSYASIAQI